MRDDSTIAEEEMDVQGAIDASFEQSDAQNSLGSECVERLKKD